MYKNVSKTLLFVLGVVALFILIQLYTPGFFNSITQDIISHLTAFRLFRWGVILFFLFSWPYITRKLGKVYAVSNEQIIQWQAGTLRITAWLILFEILVCENVINKIIHYW